jgi:AraC-like DNA-binding protein
MRIILNNWVQDSCAIGIAEHPSAEVPDPSFTERPIWCAVGKGWYHLHGTVKEEGVSIEWHDFVVQDKLDWGRTFHPRTVEVCLNHEGYGRISSNGREITIAPLTVGLYRSGDDPLDASREPRQQHQFLTIEISYDYLRHHLSDLASVLHPVIREAMSELPQKSAVGPVTRLTSRLRQIVASLRQAPVHLSARPAWYRAKVLEIAAELFFLFPDEEEIFCQRQQRLAAERVSRVVELLEKRIVDPPSLDEIGQRVGCSPFHLSRTFSASMGLTIPQFIRELRMERAAELLRTGKYNVSEVALEVGYSSMSHFSHAFNVMFGCSPAFYPQGRTRKPS